MWRECTDVGIKVKTVYWEQQLLSRMSLVSSNIRLVGCCFTVGPVLQTWNLPSLTSSIRISCYEWWPYATHGQNKINCRHSRPTSVTVLWFVFLINVYLIDQCQTTVLASDLQPGLCCLLLVVCGNKHSEELRGRRGNTSSIWPAHS